MRNTLLCVMCLLTLVAVAQGQSRDQLARQVTQAESSFAATLANRDPAAFGGFVAEEAIFFGQQPLRGRAAVVEGWKPLFEAPAAPFSWKPEIVEVLESGQLALSSGPVFDPDGKRVGTFNSIWRLDPDRQWRVIFDKGAPYCPPSEKP